MSVILAVFVAGQARAALVLPEGTSVVGPTSLLGFDASSNDYFAGGVSAVNDRNIEFLTDDFALGIDFESDGLLRLWDNLGTGDDLFNYTLRFSFVSLGGPLRDIQFRDVTGLAGGDLLFSIIDANTFELALTNVQFDPGFSHADLALSVDEPATLALIVLGLIGAFAARRRSSGFVLTAQVAP
jgi:hypothetical protein